MDSSTLKYRGNPDLETERTLLRQLSHDDASAVFSYARDSEVTKEYAILREEWMAMAEESRG